MSFSFYGNYTFKFFFLVPIGFVGSFWSPLHYGWSLYKCHVIFICRNNIVWIYGRGFFDEFKKRRRHFVTVNFKSAIKNLVTAMLTVYLAITEDFTISQFSSNFHGKIFQIFHFFFIQSQTFFLIVF